MLQVVHQTRHEKIAMYRKTKRRKLEEMLANCIQLLGGTPIRTRLRKRELAELLVVANEALEAARTTYTNTARSLLGA